MLPIGQSSKESKTAKYFEKYFEAEFESIKDLLKDSTTMDVFQESTNLDLENLPEEEITPSPGAESVTSPGFDDFEPTTWCNEIDYDDLIGNVKEKDSGIGCELLYMTSEALFAGDLSCGLGLGQSSSETAFDLSNFISSSTPIKPSESYVVVAPLKVQQLNIQGSAIPVSVPPATASSSRKRKDTLSPRSMPVYSFEEVDIKPALDIPLPAPTRGRKRTNSTVSNLSLNSKREKMYERETSDPNVKNAKAAKANRERKKKELAEMQEASQNKDLLILELQQKLKQEQLEKERYREERDAARENNIMIKGVRGVATNIREFIQCVIPPMNSTFGQMDVQIPEWFSGVSLNAGTITNIDASVQQRFDLQSNEEPSRFFTAHVNIGENVMKIEYDPHGDNGSWGNVRGRRRYVGSGMELPSKRRKTDVEGARKEESFEEIGRFSLTLILISCTPNDADVS